VFARFNFKTKRVLIEIKGVQGFLHFCCQKVQASKYADMKKRHDETMAKHERTRAACEAVKECKWKEAADLSALSSKP